MKTISQEQAAALYHQLRDGHWRQGPETLVVVRAKDVYLGAMTYSGARLDEAMDAKPRVLAHLEGRPICEGDILYDREGVKLRAQAPNHRDYALVMKLLEKKPGSPDQWATNTHYEGVQVLFWERPKEPT